MLDRNALKLLSPGLDRVAARLVRLGVSADAITLLGFGLGLAAAVAIASGAMLTGLGLILLSRLADGLDGRGAFLDIALDFAFYASIPLAFAWLAPATNAWPAAVLLAAFIGTGSSFLAFALLAERRGIKSLVYPNKGLYYLGGLTEGTETLLCFAAMCWWPAQFPLLASVFAALCGITWLARLHAGWTLLKDADRPA